MSKDGLALLKKFPEYDLILTGDNHKPFVVEYEGRYLVNPGSMMRTTAAQVDHTPRVYLWYAESNKIDIHYLPITDDVVSREHLLPTKKKEENEKRMDSFITALKNKKELKFSFRDNMNASLKTDPPKEEVEVKILEAMK